MPGTVLVEYSRLDITNSRSPPSRFVTCTLAATVYPLHPSSHALRLTLRVSHSDLLNLFLRPTPAKTSRSSNSARPPMESLALRRIQQRAATYTALCLRGCAAPPGFCNLLTLCSARNHPALFHAGNAHELQTFRGFPSPAARFASRRLLPFMPFPLANPQTRQSKL
jgi:hypothetical protein